jgi:HSP20 family protein
MSNVFYYEPFYDMDRLLDGLFGGPTGASQSATDARSRQLQHAVQSTDGAMRHLKPRMDLHEDAEKNLVTATFEFPGVTKDQIQIDVHNDRLTVSAENKLSEEHEESGYAIRERRFGKYSRTLQLPTGLNEKQIKAAMDNGVLTITFPKATAEQTPKKIAIA